MKSALRLLSRVDGLARNMGGYAYRSESLSSSSGLQTQADLFINGEFVKSKSNITLEVRNPANVQEVVNIVPEITADEFNLAVSTAKEASAGWAATPLPERQRVMFTFLSKIHQYKEDLAGIVTLENGKTISDARGDVFRGLEVWLLGCCVHEATAML
jgi:malonate-semialdehyde dehydrogenase (acetylating) / methylmalonate-semialdehyde dehydrogenase